MNTKTNKKKGFTLLETLMAISVISVSIVGPLAMAASASRLINTARNQLIAVYLAQEAIELVRYQRDTNVIAGGEWLNGLRKCSSDTPADSGHFCVVDPGTPQFFSCGDSGDLSLLNVSSCDDAYMIFLGNDKGYSYKINGNTGVTSIFKRFVQVEPFVVNGEPVGSEEGARVRVKVEWKDAYGPKEVNIQENIYNFL